MILFRVLANIAFFSVGVYHIVLWHIETKNRRYPKWITVAELILGIILCLWSFTIWFVK